ncbi:MAG: dihydroneopterin aldolase [Magnetococcales bacterium]|nr:dihydroneopterin aldolase [Magnetococcales bacterium]NGZ26739.1 dihydroneopterin aldolase [Magnetococcales bacterium]
MNDRIIIRGLRLRCTIGVEEWERHVIQELTSDLDLYFPLQTAGISDDIAQTINYKTLTKQIIQLAESSRFFLVEALAEAMANLCLQQGALQVRVQLEKPGALRFADSVGVEIHRSRQT